MTGPRFLRAEELKSLHSLCALCFNKGKVQEMLDSWPHLFNGNKSFLGNSIVCEDKGKIVSYVGIWPASAIISDKKLNIAGITYVATHPDYRKKGLMSKCLRMAIEIMRKRGYALSWLIGDRNRYGNFGFENAARKYYFSITDRSVKALPAIKHAIRKYQGDSGMLDALRHMYDKRDIRLERDAVLSRQVFSRLGKTTCLALKNKKPVSYLTVGKRWWMKHELVGYEYGGDPAGLGDLIRHVLAAAKSKNILVASPVGYDPCKPVLFRASSMWKLDTCFAEFSTAGHMILLLDLHAVLRGFISQMNRKRNILGATAKGSVTLKVKETGQWATIQFGKSVSVTDKRSKKQLVLSERDLVRLLFGLSKPGDAFKCPALLDSVLPLDFFVSPLEDI